MTRARTKRRRSVAFRPRRKDTDSLGPRVRRLRGVCRECHCLGDLVRGHQLCLFCWLLHIAGNE